MNNRHKSDADCVAQARNLIARAAKGVDHLENVAGLAFCRLTALGGMLARLEELATSRDPDAGDAAMLYAAAVCREAEVLLRYLDCRQWESIHIAGKGKDREQSPVHLTGSLTRSG